MDVLLFGTMGDIGPAVRDNLLSHGLETVLVDFPQNIFRDEPGYRRTLLSAIRRFRPTTVMPIGNSFAMARYATELRTLMPEVRICVERPDKVATLDSKVRCYALAESLGITQPRLFDKPDDVRDFYGIEEGFSPTSPEEWLKVIFKRDVSFGGHGVRMPKTLDALHKLIGHQADGEPYLIEEFVEGTEHSVDAIRFNGITRTSAYRSEAPRGANGPATIRTCVPCPAAERVAVQMLDALHYNGICGFDFIVQEDGNACLLEANPRFTGGILTQISAGFELPWMLYWGEKFTPCSLL